MNTRRVFAFLGLWSLVLAACGPAAEATPTKPAVAATATPLATKVPATTPGSVAPSPSPTATRATTVAASEAPRYGGTLVYTHIRDMPGFDPYKVTSTDLRDVLNFAYDRLWQAPRAQKDCVEYPPAPGLATGFKWLDDTTVEYSIRKGVKWQNRPPMNGRELLAADVAFNFSKLWTRMPGGEVVTDAISSIDVVDNYTLRVHLKIPFAPWPTESYDRYFLIGAPEVFPGGEPIVRWEQNVATGPFMVGEYKPGVNIRMLKNPEYWQGAPYVDSIDFRIMPEMSTQVAALRSGKSDYLINKGIPEIDEALRTTAPQVVLRTCESPFPLSLFYPTDQKPYSDVKVRRAIAMAIDRDAILKSVYMGAGVPVWTQVRPSFGDLWLDDKQLSPEVHKYLEYRPNESRQLLSEANATGFTMPIITTNRFPNQVKVAEAAVAMLREVGIQANIKLLEYPAFIQQYTAPNVKTPGVGYSGGGGGSYARAIQETFNPNGTQNRSNVRDEELIALVAEVVRTTDQNRLRDLMHKIQRIQPERAYYVWFPLILNTGAFSPRVRNIYWSGTAARNDIMWNLWLAP